MKLRRDILIPIGLLSLLLVIAGAAGLFAGKAEEIAPLSSNSNKPQGARALRLWLEESGYSVSNGSGLTPPIRVENAHTTPPALSNAGIVRNRTPLFFHSVKPFCT